MQRMITSTKWHKLFMHSPSTYDPVLDAVPVRVTSSHNAMLMRNFCIEEFKDDLFQMHPNKSPGLDALNVVMIFLMLVSSGWMMGFFPTR